jgi:uncharacterized protein
MCATAASVERSSQATGNLDAQVHETHTGVVVLIGDKAYKAKKPIVTDFLDFSTAVSRERACDHEVALNRRLAPDSYLGVAHFSDTDGAAAEPLIVMRRYPDSARLSSWSTTTRRFVSPVTTSRPARGWAVPRCPCVTPDRCSS